MVARGGAQRNPWSERHISDIRNPGGATDSLAPLGLRVIGWASFQGLRCAPPGLRCAPPLATIGRRSAAATPRVPEKCAV
jgi:hypothetical protein